MRDEPLVGDRQSRVLAETTFDRNVVVVAGAGTGKTTLLVNRLVNLVMKEPEPVPVTQVVALTFTNKAATEMKMRLRERLVALASGLDAGDGGAVSAAELRERYRLSTESIRRRADAALQDLEKAQIGTLHSFAAHVLRLHPLESGVDPAFGEDDGLRFEEHFTRSWDLWLDRELSREGANHALWRRTLGAASLDQIAEAARALCSELIDLEQLRLQTEQAALPLPLRRWLCEGRERASFLLTAHDRPKRRKIEHMLAATEKLFGLAAELGADGVMGLNADERDTLRKDVGNGVAGWNEDELEESGRLIKTAQRLLTVDQGFFRDLLSLLAPFVSAVRRSFLAEGWLSFDGLLARARALLRGHPAVRERMKRDYRAVLVDEFQDTDPVQYEILLYLAEHPGTSAESWQDVELTPGKLFIVGDPKQSIYAFRRADIEAFDRVVKKIEAGGGVVHTLTTNFRSDAAVLEPINEMFDRLFQRREHVQPSNVALEVRPNRPSGPDAGVRLRIVRPSGPSEDFDAAGATRAEADALAAWLKDELLTRPSVKPGHVALLFRALTQAETYLEALRRRDVPYVTDGEKHFFRRQEVIDLANVLRVLENPHDGIALAGILRSALGGLTDRDLYDLRQRGAFDYRASDRLDGWSHVRSASVRRLYAHLAALHGAVGQQPLAEAVQSVFDRLPMLELAAASLHGEQAVANLMKIRQTAASLADRPHLTFSGFVDLLAARLEEQPDEAESALAEESVEAVRVLTIHKAKGLEFPVVVLPGLHQGAGRERVPSPIVFDWSSGAYGLALGDRCSLAAALIREKSRLREEAERRRVLYVGMTRAKELLVLSGGSAARSTGDSVLGLLAGVGEGEIGSPETVSFRVGHTAIAHEAITAPERKTFRRSSRGVETVSAVDVTTVAETWRKREERWNAARSTPSHLTPSSVMASAQRPVSQDGSAQDRDHALLVGVLAHRVLQDWDFSSDASALDAAIEAVCRMNGEQPEGPSPADQLRSVFRKFMESEPYALLRRATILGRELPFLMSWPQSGSGCVMEGVIDLVYRLDGQLWIADYKTDSVTAAEAAARADRYREQAHIYKTAVARALQSSSVSFQFIFLRPGIAVSL